MPRVPPKNGRKFKPGQSGNPGGRSKINREMQALARDVGPECIERLTKWMRSGNWRASIAAANILLERGYGKPLQALAASLTVENRTPTFALIPVNGREDPELAAKLDGGQGIHIEAKDPGTFVVFYRESCVTIDGIAEPEPPRLKADVGQTNPQTPEPSRQRKPMPKPKPATKARQLPQELEDIFTDAAGG